MGRRPRNSVEIREDYAKRQVSRAYEIVVLRPRPRCVNVQTIRGQPRSLRQALTTDAERFAKGLRGVREALTPDTWRFDGRDPKLRFFYCAADKVS